MYLVATILAVIAVAPAFPDAEGAGMWAQGGRGGSVYYVTTLDDGTDEGTFRAAVSSTGARYVLFALSGTIELDSVVIVTEPYLTIAGQSAPGAGICIKNFGLRIEANNVVIRHLRIRLGDEKGVENNALVVQSGENVMIDHVSVSWAVDQVLDLYHYPTSATLNKLTVQWSIIAEGLHDSVHSKGAHSCGGIVRGAKNAEFSLHHNLYAHNYTRLPQLENVDGTTYTVDFRNNVIYNWGSTTATRHPVVDGNIAVNWMGNTYLTGPDSLLARGYYESSTDAVGYFNDNWIDGDNATDVFAFHGWSAAFTDEDKAGFFLSAPVATSDSIETESAAAAFASVLVYAGATAPQRDFADARVVQELLTGTGSIIDSATDVGGWPVLVAAAAPVDSDTDGMPDYWEYALGLNPFDMTDGAADADSDGYPNIEDYLNWLCL